MSKLFNLKIRALVGIMIFLGYFLLYIVRYHICVHIVDMTKLKTRQLKLKQANDSNISYTRFGSVRKISFMDTMLWDDMMMAQLFSAYHIGYCVCFPIFHTIGDRLGPTWIVGIAGFISGVLNCLTPASSYYNYWSLYVVRIITGFCAGAMQPSMVQVLRHWVPPIERNYFMWAYCGITMGTCFTFLACAAIHYYSTWPTGFYTFGALQILWSIVWVFTVTDNPSRHTFISLAELTYLTNTIGTIFTITTTNAQTPWKLILKSKSFWALCCLNFGYAWMIISLSLHGTIYYSEVIGYNIYSASALTGLPFFLRLVLGALIIHGFHWYKYNSNVRRIEHIRKYFIVVSHVIPGLLIMCTWFVVQIPGPILLTTAVALTAAGTDLTFDLCYELSPTFVNSLHTVIKIIGNTPGIMVSYLVGHVVTKYQNYPYVWKNMWCFHATVLFVAGMVFLIWGETHVQPWNAVNNTRRPINRVKPTASIMSNIVEVDEDDTSNRPSLQYKNASFFGGHKFQTKEVKLPTIQ
ncbi:sialin-like isoform X2 [Leguminivora glycinivorella]|uniref:sialin-like isoform X2 n=1 Tax=Leguminivora glycinivorella TaxID=1035111 RepID=UPI002010A323|nr:sialin-like isoform X2 [Leguminivora glycinivorella]